jgi:hypothetical protein
VSSPPDPPYWLRGPYARAAFVNAYRAVTARVEWTGYFEDMAPHLAMCAAGYLRLHQDLIASPEPPTIEQKLHVEEYRIVLREIMADFLLIPRAEVDGGTLRGDGLDSDIAALCDIGGLQ